MAPPRPLMALSEHRISTVKMSTPPGVKQTCLICRTGVCPLGMDAFTRAQYEWMWSARGAHIRRVAKAGDEGVRSVTLRRAGLPSEFIPPRKSVDNRGIWS